MDGPHIDDFHTLAAVEISKIDKQMDIEYVRVVGEAAASGMLHSSRSIIMLHKAAGHTIPIRAQMAFSILMRSMEAYGIPIVNANKVEVSKFLAAWLEDQRAKVEESLLQTAPFTRQGTEKYVKPLLDDLIEIAGAESQRLAGELNLIAARNGRVTTSNAGSGQSIAFNGPVGLVQTGAGSFGVANQHIDGASKASLNEALDRLLQDIDAANGELEFDAGEVRAIVVEAKDEVVKERPNSLRLRGLISTIGGAISYVPKFKAAYDTLKWAGNFIGVSLP